MKRFMFLLLALLSTAVSAAEDTIYLEDTVISGNQELPKVLYILPWQEMTDEALPPRSFRYSESTLLTPIYPSSYRREIMYRQSISNQSSSEHSITEHSITEHSITEHSITEHPNRENN